MKKYSIIAALLLVLGLHNICTGQAKWTGVDESVVEKYAEEHGRKARTPFINTDQGDLLLFVFLLAGSIGGFIAGYYWKIILDSKPH